MTLFLWQRAKISSSRPQVSLKVVKNGGRSRIEALFMTRFDTEALADESNLSIVLQETSAKEIVTFQVIDCCKKKTAVYDTRGKVFMNNY